MQTDTVVILDENDFLEHYNLYLAQIIVTEMILNFK